MRLHFKPKQMVACGVFAELCLVPLWRPVLLLCVCVHKVLDGSESQYSGMQIGTLQDEEDEGAAPPSQEEPAEPFLQSALGTFVVERSSSARSVHRHFHGAEPVCVCVQL